MLCADAQKSQGAAVATATYRVNAEGASCRHYAKNLANVSPAVAGRKEEKAPPCFTQEATTKSLMALRALVCFGWERKPRLSEGRTAFHAPCFFKVSSLARLAFFSNLSVQCVLFVRQMSLVCPSSLHDVSFIWLVVTRVRWNNRVVTNHAPSCDDYGLLEVRENGSWCCCSVFCVCGTALPSLQK